MYIDAAISFNHFSVSVCKLGVCVHFHMLDAYKYTIWYLEIHFEGERDFFSAVQRVRIFAVGGRRIDFGGTRTRGPKKFSIDAEQKSFSKFRVGDLWRENGISDVP